METFEIEIICTFLNNEELITCSNNHTYNLHETPLTYKHPSFLAYLFGYIGLVLFAGTMSGLTLAIFSFDLTSLKVLQKAGTPKEIKYASRIMPLVRRQYLVLVSLVLANSLAVECMPLLMDRISTPYVAVGVSVSAVLIFGEVLPQAICGRYNLVIGYYFAWLVWTLIAVLFCITFPLSKLLHWLLGANEGTFYRRAELQALVDIHGPINKQRIPSIIRTEKAALPFKQRSISDDTPYTVERLTRDEVMIINGALQLATKNAKHAMVNLDKVFMLSIDDTINIQKLQKILDEGHSRIPIYCDNNREKIMGVLLTKRLITADPCKSTTVKEFILDYRYFYPPYFIDCNTNLYLLLNTFQEGKSTHMGFVTEKQPDNAIKVIGMITLEDIIEELILEEIYDEADVLRGRNPCLARAHPVDAVNHAFKASVPKSKTLLKKSQKSLGKS